MQRSVRDALARLNEKLWFFSLFLLFSIALFGGSSFFIATRIPFLFAAFFLFVVCILLNEMVFDTMEARIILASSNGFSLAIGFSNRNDPNVFQGAGFIFPCLLFGLLSAFNVLNWIGDPNVETNIESQKEE